jgi:hypothetical protein
MCLYGKQRNAWQDKSKNKASNEMHVKIKAKKGKQRNAWQDVNRNHASGKWSNAWQHPKKKERKKNSHGSPRTKFHIVDHVPYVDGEVVGAGGVELCVRLIRQHVTLDRLLVVANLDVQVGSHVKQMACSPNRSNKHQYCPHLPNGSQP